MQTHSVIGRPHVRTSADEHPSPYPFHAVSQDLERHLREQSQIRENVHVLAWSSFHMLPNVRPDPVIYQRENGEVLTHPRYGIVYCY